MNTTTDEATPRLNFEQRQRANLIVESRGIDEDLAFELVFLRNQSQHVEALVKALKGLGWDDGPVGGVEVFCWCEPEIPPSRRHVDYCKAARTALAALEGKQ